MFFPPFTPSTIINLSFSKFIYFSFIFLLITSFISCSGSKRYENEKEEYEETSFAPAEKDFVRIFLDQKKRYYTFSAQSAFYIYDGNRKIARVNPGSDLVVETETRLRAGSKVLRGKNFRFIPVERDSLIFFDGKKFRGSLRLSAAGDSVRFINSLSLDDYLKGVLPKEMIVGRVEYFEALKAFAVCARTYTLIKMKPGREFHLYADVRDQVYGGASAENPLSNRAVDETKDLILTSGNNPAVVYYHSTCGGHTEDVLNVFSSGLTEKQKISVDYLSGISDGSPAYCSESPQFEWTEVFDKDTLVKRVLKSLNTDFYADAEYQLQDLEIKSRFPSGRVNELILKLIKFEEGKSSEEIISVYGNNIRSVIRRADNKGILKSNWFDIETRENPANILDKKIVFKGRGYGHGVGLCQWGALSQSAAGRGYREILDHYFPGTKISAIND